MAWGGTEGCEHDWDSATFYDARHTPGAGPKQATNAGSDGWRSDPRTSNVCYLCGAWQGAFGLEPTVQMYVDHTIEVLREMRRVLRPDGVCFWNIGDSYASVGKWGGSMGGKHAIALHGDTGIGRAKREYGSELKTKDLCLIPQRIALAAQADGWWVRSDILWVKPNPMPESVLDRPTDAYEHILMLTKSESYFWDKEAVAEPTNDLNTKPRNFRKGDSSQTLRHDEGNAYKPRETRNIRNVWTFPTQPMKWPKGQEHFAVFPSRLPQLCILAATSEMGCCPKCSTPWKRIVYKSGGRDWKNDRMAEIGIPGELAGEGPYKRGGSHEALNDIKIAETLGWKLGCKCVIEKPVPCLVLDPFAGSGTTAKVALGLGRRAISLDLAYHDLARKRIEGSIK